MRPILDLIRNRTQLRKLTVGRRSSRKQKSDPRQKNHAPALALLQFMEVATQNPTIEELSLSFIRYLPVSHLVRFFRMNSNIKRLEINNCGIWAGGGDTAAAIARCNTTNALQTLRIEDLTRFTKDAATEFRQIILHPSNQNLVELEMGGLRFENDGQEKAFFTAVLGKPTIKRLKLLDINSLSDNFEIIMKAATNIEALSVPFEYNTTGGERLLMTLARALPKLMHPSELKLFLPARRYPRRL